MLSIAFDSSYFIDVLQLSINSKDEVAKYLVNAVIEIFHNERLDNPGLNTPFNRSCVSLMKDIITDDLDPMDDGQMSAATLKISESKQAKKDPITFNNLLLVLKSKKLEPLKITNLCKKVEDKIIWYNSNKILKKMQGKSEQFIISADDVTKSTVLDDFVKGANDIIRNHEVKTIKSSKYIEYIDFSNIKQIEASLKMYEDRKKASIFKSGLQGFNRLFNPAGGWSPGELIAICAMSHHHKTGTMLDMARWTCMNNDPFSGRQGKPTVVFISLENDVFVNLAQWYRAAYRNIFKKNPPKRMTELDIATFVHTEFSRRGFNLIVIKESGETFGLKELKNLVAHLIETGCDVQSIYLDYLGLMRIGDYGGTHAQNIEKEGQLVREYAQQMGFSIITGVQADPTVVSMITGKSIYPVKKYKQSVFSDSKGLFKPLDIVIYQQIETNHRGESYLTYYKGKHRGQEDIPMNQKFCAYRFGEFGILDDIHGKDESVQDIYSDGYGDEEESTTSFSF